MRLPITSQDKPGGRTEEAVDARRHGSPSRRERWCLGIILGISTAIQLMVAPYQGFGGPFRGIGGDLQLYLTWGSAFDAHPLTFYTLTGANYPPLTIYMFGFVELLYRGFGSLVGLSERQLVILPHNQFAVLWFLAKLPIIAANTGSVWLIYRLARLGASSGRALLAAAAYAAAPAMLLDGAAWGQTDGVPVFFILLALLLIQSRRPAWAGVALGLALMVKPQPAIFVPILLLWILVTTGWRDAFRAIVAGLIALLAVCSPFLLPPHPELLVYYYNSTRSFQLTTSYAFNLWFLVPGGVSWSYQAPAVGPLTVTAVGIILFAPVYALALALVWLRRSLAKLYVALALAAVGFFDLTTLQRERYLFQALAFLLLAAIHFRPLVVHFIAANLTVFANMVIVCVLDMVYLDNDPHFLPLVAFFTQHTYIVFIIVLLNLQLLIGIIVSCLAWLRRSDGGKCLIRKVSGTSAGAPMKVV